jgi:hypothetical protein
VLDDQWLIAPGTSALLVVEEGEGYEMSIASGTCILLIDDEPYATCSFALESLDVPDAQHFGFLSGPPKVLKVAGSAEQVELQLDSGRTLAVQVLEVSTLGLALIKFGSAVSDRGVKAENAPHRQAS